MNPANPKYFDLLCERLGLDEDEPEEVREYLWEFKIGDGLWTFHNEWMTDRRAEKWANRFMGDGSGVEWRISSLCLEGRVRT